MGWRISVPVGAIFSVVSLDLVVRFLAEIIGFGTTVGLAVPLVVVSRLVLPLDAIGWFLGWFLFWLLLFLYAPAFFPNPEQTEDWTTGIPNRLLLASAAVGVSITLSSWFAILASRFARTVLLTSVGLSTTVSVSWRQAGWLLGATLFGYLLVKKTPPILLTHTYLPTPEGLPKGTITADRYLFAVVILGLILAVLSVMFPLPELIVLGLTTTDLLKGGGKWLTGSEFRLPDRKDITEGMTGAALAIWQDLEDVFHLVYVLAPLLWFWLLTTMTITVLDLQAILRTAPLDLAVLLGTVLTVGGYVTFYAFRLSERIRAEAVGDDLPPIIPLFLLPLGLLQALTNILRVPGKDPNAVTSLGFSPPAYLIALASIVLSVVTIWHPQKFPHPDIDDHAAAVVAVIVGTYSTTIISDIVAFGLNIISLSHFVYMYVLFPLLLASFWIGPRVFLPEEADSDKARLWTGIKGAGLFTVLGFGLLVLAGLHGGLKDPGLLGLIGLVIAFIGGVNTVVFALVLPFRLISTSSRRGS